MHQLPAGERAEAPLQKNLTAPRVASVWWWAAPAVTVACDQAAKWAAQHWLAPHHASIPLIPGILHLTYVSNTGAAFGLLRGYSGLFILLAVAIAAWLVTELTRGEHPPLSRFALGLMLGGAVGNLIDRLRIGSVIDFIDLRVWPVFNVADSAITVGVALLIWLAVRHKPSS